MDPKDLVATTTTKILNQFTDGAVVVVVVVNPLTKVALPRAMGAISSESIFDNTECSRHTLIQPTVTNWQIGSTFFETQCPCESPKSWHYCMPGGGRYALYKDKRASSSSINSRFCVFKTHTGSLCHPTYISLPFRWCFSAPKPLHATNDKQPCADELNSSGSANNVLVTCLLIAYPVGRYVRWIDIKANDKYIAYGRVARTPTWQIYYSYGRVAP